MSRWAIRPITAAPDPRAAAQAIVEEIAVRLPSPGPRPEKVLTVSSRPDYFSQGATELIEKMAAMGYWSSPGGKTPHSTLYAALLRELKTKGASARFQKTGRGQFALAPARDQA